VVARLARRLVVTRRAVAATATLTLALGTVVAAAGTSQAASGPQPAGVSVAVSGGQAFTSSPTTVAFTVTNHATNGASLAAFTLVVPVGIGAVTAAGVTGPGNWRESVVSCGTSKTCSSLVLVYGTLPLGSSLALPGQSVTASILFTTPAKPGPLAFAMIGIGRGLFTTSDHPTVNVVTGLASKFAVSAPSTVTAGVPATFTVQALDASTPVPQPIPYAGGAVNIQLGTDDSSHGAQVTPTSFGGGASAFTGSPSTIAVTLPPSATGAYTFSAVLTAAGPQSITVTETKPAPDATGTAPLTVAPAPAASIFFDSIQDSSSNPPLPNPTVGKSFVSSFHVTDIYGNPAYTNLSDVTLGATGPGSLTPISATTASPSQDGTFTDSYSAPSTGVVLTVTLTSASPQSAAALSTPVDSNAVSAVFSPAKPGSLGTANFVAPNSDGSSNCDLNATSPVCGQTILPHGANGQVSISEQLCTDSSGQCAVQGNGATPLVLSVTGNFNDSTGAPLYSDTSPASEVVTCAASQCPAFDDDGQVLANIPEESIEDFVSFPLYIQMTPAAGYVTVPSCQVIPANPAQLVSVQAVTQGSSPQACVDVASIVRNVLPNSGHYGDVSFTVYFVEDPKTHP